MGFLLLASGRRAPRLLLRVLKGILLFNSAVSIGYLIYSAFLGLNPLPYLIYINLKVVTLTYWVFLFFSEVNLLEFFSFSRELSYLLTIALSQIITFKQLFTEFRLAFRARVSNLRQQERSFIGTTFLFFLEKALKESRERSLGMKARGFFEEGGRKSPEREGGTPKG